MDNIFQLLVPKVLAMDSIIEMPEEFASGVMEATGILFSDLWIIIAVVVGVPLAFYIINKVISLIPKGK